MKMKKLTAFCTALTLLAGSLTALPVSAEDSQKPGDVDLSGNVDIADAVLLARYNAEDKEITVTAQGLLNADLTGDGKVKADDASLLLDILAGLAKAEQPSEGSQNLLKDIQAKPAEGVKADDAFRQSQLNLAVNLLRQSCTEQQFENVLVSPLSVALALSMTANGAKGDTLAEMEKVLGGEKLTISQLNDYYAGWLRSVEKEEEQKLYAADAIWFRDNKNRIDVPAEFLQTCADYYGADAYKAPFDSTTLDDINGWVNEHTHGMIDKILKKLSDASVMVLVNALAFEADWDDDYEPSQVHYEAFHLDDGSTMPVQLMSSMENWYLEDAGATGFVKRYQGGKYSFAAVLPPEGTTVDEYLASLNGEGLQKLLDSRTDEYGVFASLPKFRFDYGTSLKETLAVLGMPGAFTEGADFTGLNQLPDSTTYIGDVIHKTFIDVNEKGTKAAAATAVELVDGCAMPITKEVILDRPFVFMILDEEAGLPVFIGTLRYSTEDIPAAQEKEEFS